MLPIEVNPFIKTYPYFAIYLGALEAGGNITEGIYFNHFNELTYSMHHKELNFKNRLYLQSIMNIRKFKALTSDNALHFVKQKISEGLYVCIYLNGENIVGCKGKYYHDWMIYGYDNNMRVLYLIGYTSFKKINTYETFKISYDDFLLSLPEKKDERFLRHNFMYNHTFKVPENYMSEEIDLQRIYKKLRKEIRNSSPLIRAFSVYNKFLFQLKLFHKYPKLKKFEKFRCPMDKRNFRILYDYTKINYMIFDKFCTDKRLVNEYNKCVKTSEVIFYLSVMYEEEENEVKKNMKFKKIYEKLKILQNDEIVLIKKILLNLKSNYDIR